MSFNFPTNRKSDQLIIAFNGLRKSNAELSWEKIRLWLLQSNRSLEFGTSIANIKGLFGIGGVRSVIKKYQNNALPDKYHRCQLQVLQIINEEINPKIEFRDNEPVYDQNGFFEFTDKKLVVESGKNIKDSFEMFYWRHDEKLGAARLIVYNNGKAALEIFYPHKGVNVLLEGEAKSVRHGLITIRLHDKHQKDNNPYTQITYLHNPSTPKDCYFASFSTSHRSANMFPVAGATLLFRSEKLNYYKRKLSINDLATFLLYRQRIKTQSSGFDFIKSGDKKWETDSALANQFFDLGKFSGFFTGGFINPKRLTYETFVLHILPSGEVEMLVDANSQDGPYKGLAKIYKINRALIICYHFKKEMNDYRMRLSFNTSRLYQTKNGRIFGTMSGLELVTEEPMSSNIYITPLSGKSTSIMSYKKEIKVIDISEKEGYEELINYLKVHSLYDFFAGLKSPDYSSAAVLFTQKRNFTIE